jgi:hypothetical protein
MEFVDQPVASFYVGESGIEHVEFGDEQIPRTVPILDLAAPEDARRVTLESDPLRWAELLPTAYSSGDYSVSVVETAEVSDSPRVVNRDMKAEMEALPT